MSKIFSNIKNAPCCQGPNSTVCICGAEERIIRAYILGEVTEPMTASQRMWCIDEAVYAGEGLYGREELSVMPDKELAGCVLTAWIEYANSKY